ncbi:MAG: hypothetical protein O2783_01720 [Chloroflexi bacterium]|nr:hypothetical protein [Chloroflexota bacterium]
MRWRNLLPCLILLLVLVGCTSETATPYPTYTQYPINTAQPTYTPVTTATPYPTATVYATATPYATSTPYPTYTPHPTPTPLVTPHPSPLPVTLEWGNIDVTVGQPEKLKMISGGDSASDLLPQGVFLAIPFTMRNEGRAEEEFRATMLLYDETQTLYFPKRTDFIEGYLQVLGYNVDYDNPSSPSKVYEQPISPGAEVVKNIVFDVPVEALDFTLVLWGKFGSFMLRVGI